MFTNHESEQTLPLTGANVKYVPNFFNAQQSNYYFNELLVQTPWRADNIKVFGKVYPQPRLTALYGDLGQSYSYSGITMNTLAFTPELIAIKEAVQVHSKSAFNTVLLNLYRNGGDSNGWHSDDEKELGQNPIIASVSFGATRRFRFREKSNSKNTYTIRLEAGSLLLMRGATQHNWQHQIPKTKQEVGPRINLTFRVLL